MRNILVALALVVPGAAVAGGISASCPADFVNVCTAIQASSSNTWSGQNDYTNELGAGAGVRFGDATLQVTSPDAGFAAVAVSTAAMGVEVAALSVSTAALEAGKLDVAGGVVTGDLSVDGVTVFASSTTASRIEWADGSVTTSANAGGGGGLTQLTGQVIAGPGTGAQVATIAAGVVDSTKLASDGGSLIKVSGGLASVVGSTVVFNSTVVVNGLFRVDASTPPWYAVRPEDIFVVGSRESNNRVGMQFFPPAHGGVGGLFKMGLQMSGEGDPFDRPSDGIYIVDPTLNRGVRIKADAYRIAQANNTGNRFVVLDQTGLKISTQSPTTMVVNFQVNALDGKAGFGKVPTAYQIDTASGIHTTSMTVDGTVTASTFVASGSAFIVGPTIIQKDYALFAGSTTISRLQFLDGSVSTSATAAVATANTALALASAGSEASSGYLCRGVDASGNCKTAYIDNEVTAGSTNPVSGAAVSNHLSGTQSQYYFTPVASAISGYRIADVNGAFVPVTGSSQAQNIAVNGVVISSWVTEVGLPGVVAIPAGSVACHFHASKTAAGTGEVYCTLWRRTNSGVETLLATTEASGNITTTEKEYDLHGYMQSSTMTTTDRLVFKANGLTSSGSPLITVFFDGVGTSQTNAGFGLPGQSVITSGQIADGAVDTNKLAADAVVTTKIINAGVTDEKIQSVSASKVTGGIDPAQIDLSTVTNELGFKLDDGVAIDPAIIDLSTVVARAGDYMTGALTVYSSATIAGTVGSKHIGTGCSIQMAQSAGWGTLGTSFGCNSIDLYPADYAVRINPIQATAAGGGLEVNKGGVRVSTTPLTSQAAFIVDQSNGQVQVSTNIVMSGGVLQFADGSQQGTAASGGGVVTQAVDPAYVDLSTVTAEFQTKASTTQPSFECFTGGVDGCYFYTQDFSGGGSLEIFTNSPGGTSLRLSTGTARFEMQGDASSDYSIETSSTIHLNAGGIRFPDASVQYTAATGGGGGGLNYAISIDTTSGDQNINTNCSSSPLPSVVGSTLTLTVSAGNTAEVVYSFATKPDNASEIYAFYLLVDGDPAYGSISCAGLAPTWQSNKYTLWTMTCLTAPLSAGTHTFSLQGCSDSGGTVRVRHSSGGQSLSGNGFMGRVMELK